MTDFPKFERLFDTIERKGFDYAFTEYSSFNKIDNTEFHALRKIYLNARKKFITFLNTKTAGRDFLE